MRVSAIIPGAGRSLRFSEGEASPLPSSRKQFRALGGVPLIFVTLKPFLESGVVQSVILVVPEDSLDWTERQLAGRRFEKDVRLAVGGRERQLSVRSGLEAVGDACDVVVIHDAVRPFVRSEWIKETASLCSDYDGAIVAIRARDTLKRVREATVQRTIDRSEIWYAQTPQAFQMKALLSAFKNADARGVVATDEAQLVELNGGRIKIIEGSSKNIKITTQEDWKVAEAIWKGRTVGDEVLSIEGAN